MSDYNEFMEYYKKHWEKSLSERTTEMEEEIKTLRSQNARYRGALYFIACYDYAENEQSLDEPYSALIAREALRGDVTPEKGDK